METNKNSKKESKFYIAKTINKAKEKIETRVKTYNEKYVKKQIEKGHEFIKELKADPVKTIDDLIYDSNNAVKKIKSNSRETLQKKVDATKKNVREKFEKMNQKTSQIYKGIENDTKLIAEDFIAPRKKNIEKKISASVDSISSKLNIPSKSEIDNLVMGIEGVNKKVDALNKQYAGA